MNMWSYRDVIMGIGVILVFFSCYTLALYILQVDGDWISYYGAVLGSTISIGVIALTLGQNKKHHKELMAEQNRKHEELVQLQINTALHSKKQERLRGVIADLRNIYSSTHPKKINDITLTNGIKNTDSAIIQIAELIKSISSIRASVDLTININKDIIDISGLNYYNDKYF